MVVNILREIFNRDLNKLRDEVNLYQNEENLWVVEKDIDNSGGNLCLHLVGNLNTYIGSELGDTAYVRDRVGEFTNKNIPKSKLSAMVDETMQIVDQALVKISDDDLQKMYPVEVFKEPMTTEYFLVHLATHLTYHLGQINYHRRLLDVKDN